MGLSINLLKIVSLKLNLILNEDIQEDIIYFKKLLKKGLILQNESKNIKYLNNFTDLSLIIKNYDKEEFLIVYIINVFFLKSNTIIQISDSKGTVKIFFSSGSVNLSGKQKKKRRIAITKLISLLSNNSSFVGKNPVALHLNNVYSHKSLIINRLKKRFFIKIIKSFNKIPFNGCRKKKLKRKRYKKILK